MMTTKKITMDMLNRGITPRIDAVQNDVNSRCVEIQLTRGGENWQPEGLTPAVAFRKPDGTSGLYDTLPDGSAAGMFDQDTVTLTLAPQVLTCPGRVMAALVLMDENLNRVSTFPFEIHVAPDPSAGKHISNDYYRYTTLAQLNAAMEALQEQVGEAADAAQVYAQRAEESAEAAAAAARAVEAPVWHYADLPTAIADINAGVLDNAKPTKAGAMVLVQRSSSGRPAVILLGDVDVSEAISVEADMELILNGCCISLDTEAARLYFGAGTDCLIDGRGGGSVVKTGEGDGLTVTAVSQLLRAEGDSLNLLGGEYRMKVAEGSASAVVMDIRSAHFRAEDTQMILENTAVDAGSSRVLQLVNASDARLTDCELSGISSGELMTAYLYQSAVRLTGCTVSAESEAKTAIGMWNLLNSSAELTGCTVTAVTCTDGANMGATGISNAEGCVLRVNNCTIMGDAPGDSADEDCANGISSAGTAYLRRCTVDGTLAGVSSSGKLYVSGGVYTGYSHGGFYFTHNADGEAYIRDVVSRCGNYSGRFADIFSGDTVGAWSNLYIGSGAEGALIYMDGCDLSEAGGQFGASLTNSYVGSNNTLYLSNCAIGKQLRVDRADNDTGLRVKLGVGNTFAGEPVTEVTEALVNNPAFAEVTGLLYRRAAAEDTLGGNDLQALREADLQDREAAVQKIVETLCPEVTDSGTLAVLPDLLEGFPVEIAPAEGTVLRSGKNLLNTGTAGFIRGWTTSSTKHSAAVDTGSVTMTAAADAASTAVRCGFVIGKLADFVGKKVTVSAKYETTIAGEKAVPILMFGNTSITEGYSSASTMTQLGHTIGMSSCSVTIDADDMERPYLCVLFYYGNIPDVVAGDRTTYSEIQVEVGPATAYEAYREETLDGAGTIVARGGTNVFRFDDGGEITASGRQDPKILLAKIAALTAAATATAAAAE